MQHILVYSDSATWGKDCLNGRRAVWDDPFKPGRLVIAPPAIQTANKSAGLATAYREVCEGLGCHLFDAGTVIGTSAVDGVHLDADHHARLGAALAALVATLPLSGDPDA